MQSGEDAKVNIKRGWGRYFFLGCIGALLIFILSGVICGFLIFRVWLDESDLLDRIPRDFCTQDDEIFQIFVANRSTWVDSLKSADHSYAITDFSTSENRRYSVIYEWSFHEVVADALLVVIVNSAHDSDVQAYIFSPNELPNVSGGEIKFLGQDIYCFNYSSYYSLNNDR